jgi:hypothetical protein
MIFAGSPADAHAPPRRSRQPAAVTLKLYGDLQRDEQSSALNSQPQHGSSAFDQMRREGVAEYMTAAMLGTPSLINRAAHRALPIVRQDMMPPNHTTARIP